MAHRSDNTRSGKRSFPIRVDNLFLLKSQQLSVGEHYLTWVVSVLGTIETPG